jgi:hypothetical protein
LNPNRQIFLRFCAEMTGYTAISLEGTGLVDLFQQLLETVIGENIARDLYGLAESILSIGDPAKREELIRTSILPSAIIWPVVSNLIGLWYLGAWNQLSPAWYAAAGLPVPGPGDAGRLMFPRHHPIQSNLHTGRQGRTPRVQSPRDSGVGAFPRSLTRDRRRRHFEPVLPAANS